MVAFSRTYIGDSAGSWQAAVLPPQKRLIPITAPAPTMPTASPGQQLTGNVGLWVNGVLGYAYQLTRDGIMFQSGSWLAGALYTVQASDVGSVIALIVTATNRSGAGPVASSVPTLIVS